MKKNSTPPTDPALQALLGDDSAARWWRRPMLWTSVLALLLVVGSVLYWQEQKASNNAPVFVTEALRTGNLTLTVSANGTLQPTRAVNVGSELSGTVRRVLVDVNDRVSAGQVLVELDTAKLNDQVQRSRASLAAARAALAQSAATVKESQATLARFEEVSRLSGGKVPSGAELDQGRAAVDRALAAQASAQANVTVVRTNVSTDETNLAKASVRSPIDGVVLSRTVDPGNAVAASLQAVTLFSVAENLAQLKLAVNVDEADVGAVKVGQKASFTVSAYPSRRYPATIRRVDFGSTKTENVVTYVATLDVDNTDLSLRPGMTASSTIVATERTGVLLVPNTALRFTPAATKTTAGQTSVLARMMPGPPRAGGRKAAGTEARAPGKRQIWVLKDNQPVAMQVTTGISDGRSTEVSGEGLSAGLAVIVDQRAAGK
jgi:HlyD family secretion protein